MSVMELLQKAKAATGAVAALTAPQRDALLRAMAARLVADGATILAANEADIENARGRIAEVMIDRLRLTEGRIADMAEGMLAVAALPGPLGVVEQEYTHQNGLYIRKVRVPVGVVAMVYESRPNVTADAAALCLKSGNVCVLRGGSDALRTNIAIAESMQAAIAAAGGPENAINLVRSPGRESVQQLMEARGFVDLLIPRGGAGLIRAVVDGAKGVPVIETGTGICHVYVDAEADLDMAVSILYNAKTSRPSVCNSAEVCLVHKDVAGRFLPMAAAVLEGKVELRLDEAAAGIIAGTPAGPEDFDTEFLDYVLAVGVVGSLEEAIGHINAHSTHHSDAIVTADAAAAAAFLQQVDSAAVYHNASTRFTDGGEFGLGCEIGISTQKIGARGPMGLYELTSYKYVVEGTGQVR
ncbi:glutamate-5-semialdehyde dehydrogenase [Ruminococcaceae bacterium OttesenSCG-928-O06]|nr:glutamate-5-semialdehyde dehydrogenase [Ruminococcaceae bacterium OttesenSCG-928-O06]